ncbi:hypothetical protein Cgig2_007884 [Carnegiea gigantea]|uniref:HMA domain-containing protein n=1 Tax=Carnegiea gigantea TaxID=171969 RepID=A0A9Q1KDC7_9CARY|nr:hypothetical protein Cgig2_007884 [Carnegiea gigantea]
MNRLVLSLDVHDNTKCKQRAMKMASIVQGVNAISLDLREKKLTVTGSMDVVEVAARLRKVYYTTIVSVGPAKQPEKPKELASPSCIVYMDRRERRITTVNDNSVQCGPCLCGLNTNIRFLDHSPVCSLFQKGGKRRSRFVGLVFWLDIWSETSP